MFRLGTAPPGGSRVEPCRSASFAWSEWGNPPDTGNPAPGGTKGDYGRNMVSRCSKPQTRWSGGGYLGVSSSKIGAER